MSYRKKIRARNHIFCWEGGSIKLKHGKLLHLDASHQSYQLFEVHETMLGGAALEILLEIFCYR
jgi:hypothetical protein